MKKYNYLIVGSGLFGATFAYQAQQAGKTCLVIDRRDHIGGNIYCKDIDGVNVHMYGAHIFHTSNKAIWDFVNQFVTFNNYRHSVVANYKGQLFNLPFNMNTFYQLWGVKTPAAAKAKIAQDRMAAGITEPKNLEEQAIALVGREVYTKLIKEYTEKQWGRRAVDLPAFIIKRLPVRFTFDNNYFYDTYQGIPIGGYNILIEGLLKGCEVRLNCDYFTQREELNALADTIIFTGRIDEYYNFKFGTLDYRSLRFETETLDMENYQGCSVMNYTDPETPYTRIIEHKHFALGAQPKTVITREYPMAWEEGMEIYYPINDEVNNKKYQQYKVLADAESSTFFGGRLAEYKYYDMHNVIESAMNLASKII